jgi:hypothetical protein
MALHDPVREYDGLCQYGERRISPEEMTEISLFHMRNMELSAEADEQDREANATPIGGQQFK